MEDSQAENNIPLLTFNSLYNLLREEKKSKKLFKTNEQFYEALNKYFEDKKKEIDTLKKEGSDKLRREKLVYRNSQKIAQELLNLRCMKIADIAIKDELFGDDILSKEEILEEELKFFEETKKAIKKIKPKYI